MTKETASSMTTQNFRHFASVCKRTRTHSSIFKTRLEDWRHKRLTTTTCKCVFCSIHLPIPWCVKNESSHHLRDCGRRTSWPSGRWVVKLLLVQGYLGTFIVSGATSNSLFIETEDSVIPSQNSFRQQPLQHWAVSCWSSFRALILFINEYM